MTLWFCISTIAYRVHQLSLEVTLAIELFITFFLVWEFTLHDLGKIISHLITHRRYYSILQAENIIMFLQTITSHKILLRWTCYNIYRTKVSEKASAQGRYFDRSCRRRLGNVAPLIRFHTDWAVFECSSSCPHTSNLQAQISTLVLQVITIVSGHSMVNDGLRIASVNANQLACAHS